MNERPILFNAEMVNAILSGGKTQTRRVIKGCPDVQHGWYPDRYNNSEEWTFWGPRGSGDAGRCTLPFVKCPFGEIGDQLYVRESYQGPLIPEDEISDFNGANPDRFYTPKYCEYAADGGPRPEYVDGDDNTRFGWRPSIHMPRWASRITLEITGVRVERLNDIDQAGALAEGITDSHGVGMEAYNFSLLWREIYGADSWQANPWVWVVEFKRVDGEVK